MSYLKSQSNRPVEYKNTRKIKTINRNRREKMPQ